MALRLKVNKLWLALHPPSFGFFLKVEIPIVSILFKSPS
jgi:hypothetical protein